MADFPTVQDVELETPLSDGDSPRLPLPMAESWRKMKRGRQTRMLRKALAFQRQLEKASQELALLSSLTRATQTQAANAGDLARLSTEITSSSLGLKDLFSALAANALHNERRQATGSPARPVFDVPELLERILSHLNVRELLRAMEVDWTLFNAIQSSPTLQENLCLRPSPSGHLATAFNSDYLRRKRDPPRHARFEGLSCHWSMQVNAKHATIIAQFESELPRIGNRCRTMLLCQPPVHEMGVFPLCCSYNTYIHDMVDPFGPFGAFPMPPAPPQNPFNFGPPIPPPAAAAAEDSRKPRFENIISKTGITVGHLYDAAVEVQKSHELCPWARPRAHDNQGNVRVCVSFGGTVALKPDDPAIRPAYDLPQVPDFFSPLDVEPTSAERPRKLIRRYIEAKRRAFEIGVPRPTFQEFKASIDPATGLYPGEEDGRQDSSGSDV